MQYLATFLKLISGGYLTPIVTLIYIFVTEGLKYLIHAALVAEWQQVLKASYSSIANEIAMLSVIKNKCIDELANRITGLLSPLLYEMSDIEKLKAKVGKITMQINAFKKIQKNVSALPQTIAGKKAAVARERG